MNPVDASLFLPRYKTWETDGFPYDIKTSKTPVKIYRMCYDRCNKVGEYDVMWLKSSFIKDVSAEYGLTSNVAIKADCASAVYLCAYMSGRDWVPVAKAFHEGGNIIFPNVGKGSVCVPIAVVDGKKKALSCPFLVGSNGIERWFSPSPSGARTITIDRKYPLCSYTTDTWAGMRGAVFEGSMTADFSVADTLAVITAVPSYMTTIDVSSSKRYRFCVIMHQDSIVRRLRNCCFILLTIPETQNSSQAGILQKEWILSILETCLTETRQQYAKEYL